MKATINSLKVLHQVSGVARLLLALPKAHFIVQLAEVMPLYVNELKFGSGVRALDADCT